jgi:hypothetical protein
MASKQKVFLSGRELLKNRVNLAAGIISMIYFLDREHFEKETRNDIKWSLEHQNPKQPATEQEIDDVIKLLPSGAYAGY